MSPPLNIPSKGESGLAMSVGGIVAFLSSFAWKHLTGEELPGEVSGFIVTAVTLGGIKWFGRGKTAGEPQVKEPTPGGSDSVPPPSQNP